MLSVGFSACAPACGTHKIQHRWFRRRTDNRLTLTRNPSHWRWSAAEANLLQEQFKKTHWSLIIDAVFPLEFQVRGCLPIVYYRSCQPAVLLLIVFSSLINVANGRLNKTAGKFKPRCTKLVCFDTEDRKVTLKFVQVLYFLGDGAMNSNDGESGNWQQGSCFV